MEGHVPMAGFWYNKKEEEKRDIHVEDILALFNEISIECGN